VLLLPGRVSKALAVFATISESNTTAKLWMKLSSNKIGGDDMTKGEKTIWILFIAVRRE
jgi:hypothetical protein